MRHVGHAQHQHEVGPWRDAVALLHGAVLHGAALERLQMLVALPVQRDFGQRRQALALQRGHAVFVQQRDLRADQSRFTQPPHAPQRRGGRHAYALGQRLVAFAGVGLQGGQQSPIGGIQFHKRKETERIVRANDWVECYCTNEPNWLMKFQ